MLIEERGKVNKWVFLIFRYDRARHCSTQSICTQPDITTTKSHTDTWEKLTRPHITVHIPEAAGKPQEDKPGSGHFNKTPRFVGNLAGDISWYHLLQHVFWLTITAKLNQ